MRAPPAPRPRATPQPLDFQFFLEAAPSSLFRQHPCPWCGRKLLCGIELGVPSGVPEATCLVGAVSPSVSLAKRSPWWGREVCVCVCVCVFHQSPSLLHSGVKVGSQGRHKQPARAPRVTVLGIPFPHLLLSLTVEVKNGGIPNCPLSQDVSRSVPLSPCIHMGCWAASGSG